MAQIAKTMTIENTSDIPQWVMVDGKEEVIPEFGVLDFRRQVAEAFIRERGRWCREYEPIKLPEPGPTETTMWIANMTGNPFLPETVTDVRISRGKEEEIEIPNPLRKPFTVDRIMHGAQVIQQCRFDPTAMESINLPPTRVKVPPFRRFKVGSKLGDWLIRRDSQQHRILVGQLAQVAPPRDFEPQQHWDVEDLQVYGSLIDRRTFNPDNPQFGELMTKTTRDYETEAVAVDAAITLWRAIWFRVLDERYGSPSSSDMEIFRKAKRSPAAEQKKRSLAERLQEHSEAQA